MRCIKLKASLTQRGVLRISSGRDDQTIFLRRKILASIFWVYLFFVLYQLMLSGNFYGWEIRHGILGGLKFGPGMFLGFV